MFLLASSTGIEAHWNQCTTSQSLWKCGPNILPWFLYPTSFFEHLLCALCWAEEIEHGTGQGRSLLSGANLLFDIKVVVRFSSVAQSCPTLCDPTDCSMPGFPVHHQLQEFIQTHVIVSVMPSKHLILCHPLLLLFLVFPRIRIFSNESVLCIRCAKYWSFSFSISPSN